ncbi:phage protein [Providencia stuartii]|uniref:phage protein n=1 Tax=Providencia stuartii TaxID=588 RepID=UPI00300C72CE
MKQFGRQLKLVIGNQDEAFEVTNLRVTFDVKKTLSSEPNPAIIRIYNLNTSHRNLLTSKVFNRVALSVGYDELRLIYSGDIIDAKITESAEDLICELACGDGFSAYTSSLVNKTLAAGNSDADILKENAQAMGIEIGITELSNDRQLPRGKVMFTDAREILHKIAKNNQADWSVQDGQLTLLPKNKVVTDNEGFILSQETGLIGKPEKNETGLVITCLCNPALKIGALVRINSMTTELNGDYKIIELSHMGDFMEKDWYSKLVCIGGEFNKVKL